MPLPLDPDNPPHLNPRPPIHPPWTPAEDILLINLRPRGRSFTSLARLLGKSKNAVSGRVQRALEKAAALLEPEVRLLRLPSATLRTEADLDAWLERVKVQIGEEMRHGPVLVR